MQTADIAFWLVTPESGLVAGLWLPWYISMAAAPIPSLHIRVALWLLNVATKMSTSDRSLDDLAPLLDEGCSMLPTSAAIEETRPGPVKRSAYVLRSRGEVARARGLMETALARYEEDHSAFGLTYETSWAGVDTTAGDVAAGGRLPPRLGLLGGVGPATTYSSPPPGPAPRAGRRRRGTHRRRPGPRRKGRIQSGPARWPGPAYPAMALRRAAQAVRRPKVQA